MAARLSLITYAPASSILHPRAPAVPKTSGNTAVAPVFVKRWGCGGVWPQDGDGQISLDEFSKILKYAKVEYRG
eukprot:1181050-Prorocentrum_minimum.AAC.2